MKVRDNSDRARIVLMMFYILFAMLPMVLISDFWEYNLLHTDYSIEEGESNDNRQLIINLFYLLAYILAGIAFVMWFRRAYYNLQAAGISTIHKDGWAAGAWFVPILNLYRPYQIMIEIWEKVQNKIQSDPYESKTLVGLWWGGWIIGGLADRISTRMGLSGTTIEDLQASSAASIVSDILTWVTLVFIIMIVRKIAHWEKTFYDQSHEMAIEDHLI